MDGILSSRPVFSGTCPTHPSEGPSPTVPAVPRRPPPSSTPPAVPYRPLPSPTRICLRSWGLSSFLMTAFLEIQGRGRTAFCRPVSSRALGSPPAGPYGGPGRLRTLLYMSLYCTPPEGNLLPTSQLCR